MWVSGALPHLGAVREGEAASAIAATATYERIDDCRLEQQPRLAGHAGGGEPLVWRDVQADGGGLDGLVGRYFERYSRLVVEVRGELESSPVAKAFTDSDCAGCRATRQSRSGDRVQMMTWNGEAGHYRVVKACAEALGMQSLAGGLGYEVVSCTWAARRRK